MDRREGDRSGVYSKNSTEQWSDDGKKFRITEASVDNAWWYDSGGNAGMQHVMSLVGIIFFPVLRVGTSDDGRCT